MQLKTDLKKWSVLAVMPILVACSSVSPGMHYAGIAESAAGTEEADDGTVKPTLKPITPQLLKAEKAMREKQATQDISKLLGKPGTYNIESGDVLSIVVWDHPELAGPAIAGAPGAAGTVMDPITNTPATQSAGFVVDQDGVIQFPYAGALKVAGMTQDQARTMLTKKLAHYIRNPKITLRVQSFRSKRVYIDGEVKTPGLQPINDIAMTLMEAINRAGGMLPTADQSQIMVNRSGTNYHINLPQLVQKGVNPSNIMLANGDVVRVLSRDESKIFVSGEVTQPRSLTMHNGRLTLNEALGESGGISPISGDASQVYVIRKSSTQPIVYRLDAKAPGALALAESFELQPKDVVYVAATPLANWNRTISQILPGQLSGAVGAGAGFK
jgi:polysaccharide export outer membrane protein